MRIIPKCREREGGGGGRQAERQRGKQTGTDKVEKYGDCCRTSNIAVIRFRDQHNPFTLGFFFFFLSFFARMRNWGSEGGDGGGGGNRGREREGGRGKEWGKRERAGRMWPEV